MRDGLLLVPVVGTLNSHRARLLTIRMLDAIKDIATSAEIPVKTEDVPIRRAAAIACIR